ncbi:unnamed protein product, partial [Urochloa humidicola]
APVPDGSAATAARRPQRHLRAQVARIDRSPFLESSPRPAAMVGGSSSTKMVRTEPNPAAQLTDDLLVEILARVPYRSLCRFRCVSQRWRALISHPDNRRRLPQTLTGFFYCGPSAAAAAGAGGSQEPAPTGYCFADVAGASWPLTLSFLPDREREELMLVDSCNGLLLCRCYRFPDDEDEFDYLIL